MFNKLLKNNIKISIAIFSAIFVFLGFFNEINVSLAAEDSCRFYKCDDSTANNFQLDITGDPDQYNGSCKWWLCDDSTAENYHTDETSVKDQYNTACQWTECPYDSSAMNHGDLTYDPETINICLYRLCNTVGDSNYAVTTTVPTAAGTQCTSGCTDPNDIYYDPGATIDDGSCSDDDDIEGCTDPLANNYNEGATEDDGSCTYDATCQNPDADNYDPDMVYPPYPEDEELCVISGCMDSDADNYNSNATQDDGSCTYTYNCHDSIALNYDASGVSNPSLCEYYACGDAGNSSAINFEDPADIVISSTGGLTDSCDFLACNDSDADNYLQIVDDIDYVGCQYTGCIFPTYAANYDSALAALNTGNNVVTNSGCNFYTCNHQYHPNDLDLAYENYQTNTQSTDNNNSTALCTVGGCTDTDANNYNQYVTYDDGSCTYDATCQNPDADNYDPSMVYPPYPEDENLCVISGCMDSDAANYDSLANTEDNESCIFEGCFDTDANNYNSTLANKPYGGLVNLPLSCTYDATCQNPDADNYDPDMVYPPYPEDEELCVISGCMDSDADNYNSNATQDDGSCTYTYNCHDSIALNYDASGVSNPSLCEYYACGDLSNSLALNYRNQADTVTSSTGDPVDDCEFYVCDDGQNSNAFDYHTQTTFASSQPIPICNFYLCTDSGYVETNSLSYTSQNYYDYNTGCYTPI